MFDAFLHLFLTLLIIIDPFGLIPYFLALTSDFSKKERALAISKAVLFAFAILCIFAVFGQYLLEYLSLSIASFKVAGGLLLLWVAFEMILSHPKPPKEKENVALAPLATPLLAGPAAIATIIIYTGQASDFVISRLIIIGIILAVLFLTWLILINSEYLFKILKKQGALALAKIMGLILAALAVEMIFAGAKILL